MRSHPPRLRPVPPRPPPPPAAGASPRQPPRPRGPGRLQARGEGRGRRQPLSPVPKGCPDRSSATGTGRCSARTRRPGGEGGVPHERAERGCGRPRQRQAERRPVRLPGRGPAGGGPCPPPPARGRERRRANRDPLPGDPRRAGRGGVGGGDPAAARGRRHLGAAEPGVGGVERPRPTRPARSGPGGHQVPGAGPVLPLAPGRQRAAGRPDDGPLPWGQSRSIARNARRLRLEAGLRQADVAKAAGIAQSTVSNIERGAVRITAGQARAMARAFGVTAEALAGDAA